MKSAQRKETTNVIVNSTAIVASTAAVVIAIESSLPGNTLFTLVNIFAIGVVISVLLTRGLPGAIPKRAGQYANMQC